MYIKLFEAFFNKDDSTFELINPTQYLEFSKRKRDYILDTEKNKIKKIFKKYTSKVILKDLKYTDGLDISTYFVTNNIISQTYKSNISVEITKFLDDWWLVKKITPDFTRIYICDTIDGIIDCVNGLGLIVRPLTNNNINKLLSNIDKDLITKRKDKNGR